LFLLTLWLFLHPIKNNKDDKTNFSTIGKKEKE